MQTTSYRIEFIFTRLTMNTIQKFALLNFLETNKSKVATMGTHLFSHSCAIVDLFIFFRGLILKKTYLFLVALVTIKHKEIHSVISTLGIVEINLLFTTRAVLNNISLKHQFNMGVTVMVPTLRSIMNSSLWTIMNSSLWTIMNSSYYYEYQEYIHHLGVELTPA